LDVPDTLVDGNVSSFLQDETVRIKLSVINKTGILIKQLFITNDFLIINLIIHNQ